MFKKKLDQDLIKYLEKLENKIDTIDYALEEKLNLIIKKNINFDNLNNFLLKLNESVDHFKIQNENFKIKMKIH